MAAPKRPDPDKEPEITELQKIREYTGMNQAEFARCFHIPLRSYQSWESNSKTCKRPRPYLTDYLAHITGYRKNPTWEDLEEMIKHNQ